MVEVDTSETLEILREIAELSQHLGDSVSEHVRARCRHIGEREAGFFQIKVEAGTDGQIAIKVVPGHELLAIWATLMAEVPRH